MCFRRVFPLFSRGTFSRFNVNSIYQKYSRETFFFPQLHSLHFSYCVQLFRISPFQFKNTLSYWHFVWNENDENVHLIHEMLEARLISCLNLNNCSFDLMYNAINFLRFIQFYRVFAQLGSYTFPAFFSNITFTVEFFVFNVVMFI